LALMVHDLASRADAPGSHRHRLGSIMECHDVNGLQYDRFETWGRFLTGEWE
jgi:hypothetical protein